jgi:eukaryotic-like serine/threonine-protein kinase
LIRTPSRTAPSAIQPPPILEAFADERLLSRDRFRILRDELLPRCNDWNVIASEMIFRGWVTPFQVARIQERRSYELFYGSYLLEEEIGEGGMGTIYRAKNWKLGTTSAVKVMRKERSSDPVVVGRFLREIEALGAIQHPNIVHAHDADVCRDQLYVAMEYVPGSDLGVVLHKKGHLSVETACRYAIQIAEALHHISLLGFVHRDVKPNNVLITHDGKVKLLDLGLARFDGDVPENDNPEITRVGIMVGTPDYVSPEQIRDSHTADIRSDIYSLGATLYHMLAGRTPFDGRNTVEKLHSHLTKDPVSPKVYNPEIPVELVRVIRTMMAKKPRDRHQDPSEVLIALRPFAVALGETVDDVSAPTSPGLPTIQPNPALPRTEEIPLEELTLLGDLEAESRRPFWTRVSFWLHRLHWLFAILIAGIALGFVIGRR